MHSHNLSLGRCGLSVHGQAKGETRGKNTGSYNTLVNRFWKTRLNIASVSGSLDTGSQKPIFTQALYYSVDFLEPSVMAGKCIAVYSVSR